jgi:cytidylate kinase
MTISFSSSGFRNITISGKVAVGSTTLFNGLREKLSPLGWQFFSGGEFTREYAVKNNLFPKESRKHHAATVYSDEFDREVDTLIRKKLEEESHLVIESDLAGFNAQNIPSVLKILLVCDDALRIDRLVNRDNITIEEAKKHLKIREEENTKKWQRLYGRYDFWDPKFYDLIIDTYKHSPIETLNLVLDKIGYSQR